MPFTAGTAKPSEASMTKYFQVSRHVMSPYSQRFSWDELEKDPTIPHAALAKLKIGETHWDSDQEWSYRRLAEEKKKELPRGEMIDIGAYYHTL